MKKKILKYLVLVVLLGNLAAALAVVFLGVKSKPRQPLPNPNGYDDFVRAGRTDRGL